MICIINLVCGPFVIIPLYPRTFKTKIGCNHQCGRPRMVPEAPTFVLINAR